MSSFPRLHASCQLHIILNIRKFSDSLVSLGSSSSSTSITSFKLCFLICKLFASLSFGYVQHFFSWNVRTSSDSCSVLLFKFALLFELLLWLLTRPDESLWFCYVSFLFTLPFRYLPMFQIPCLVSFPSLSAVILFRFLSWYLFGLEPWHVSLLFPELSCSCVRAQKSL